MTETHAATNGSGWYVLLRGADSVYVKAASRASAARSQGSVALHIIAGSFKAKREAMQRGPRQ